MAGINHRPYIVAGINHRPYIPMPETQAIRIGISACLLGHKVRYDGSHKYNEFIDNAWSRYFEWVAICPEIGIGMGAPRPPIRLVRLDNGEVRALGIKNSALDVTAPLSAYFEQVRASLLYPCSGYGISGYIVKKNSPSCGLLRVKIYHPNGTPQGGGTGLYTQALQQALPDLPIEEEGRLQDNGLRESFIVRVLAYHRWQLLLAQGLTASAWVNFHTRHKLLLMAHNQAAYRRLGQQVARNAGVAIAGQMVTNDPDHGPSAYFSAFMQALARRATAKSHGNVLLHLLGYLKTTLDKDDKAELLGLIDAAQRGKLPLIVPLTLLNHHFRRHPNAYVAEQHYMNYELWMMNS